jgi:hypothetical protein
VRKLSELVKDRRASGVYILAGDAGAVEVGHIAQGNGLAFFSLSGRDVRSKDTLLQEAGKACNFPDYFGHNWDAFEECVTDMSWQPAPGYLLLVDELASLREKSPGDFDTFLAVLHDAASSWASQGKAFFVLIHDPTYRNQKLETVEI